MEPSPVVLAPTSRDGAPPPSVQEPRWRRLLAAAVATVWLPLPPRSRVRVPAPMRSAVRAGIARARAMRETDDPADPDRLPVARATAALRILLTAVGRATAADTDNPDEPEAIRRRAARVAATLADPALKDTLAAATDNRQVVPMSPRDPRGLPRLRAPGDRTEALL